MRQVATDTIDSGFTTLEWIAGTDLNLDPLVKLAGKMAQRDVSLERVRVLLGNGELVAFLDKDAAGKWRWCYDGGKVFG